MGAASFGRDYQMQTRGAQVARGRSRDISTYA
jgi:hypothetical protein